MKSVKIDSLHMELFSGKKTKNLILDHLIEILLLALIIGVSIAAPSFLKSGNILNILRNAAMKGVIAYGMCLVIISGEIDLSVGSQVALSGVLAGFISKGLAEAGIMPIELGALVGIAAATLVALLTGLFHAWARQKFNMPSFIITLATLNVMYGFAAIVCRRISYRQCLSNLVCLSGKRKDSGNTLSCHCFYLNLPVFLVPDREN